MPSSSLMLGVLALCSTAGSVLAAPGVNVARGPPPPPPPPPGPPGPEPKYTSLVVFGDSFSDNGNEYKLSNRTWPADPAYYNGRFSNGPVWDEDVASTLRLPLKNYAYGGATTDNALVQGFSGRNSDIPVPALADQVHTYLTLPSSPSSAPAAGSLHVLLGGANDVFFQPNISAAKPAAVLDRLAHQLAAAGARDFLLLNYPDLGSVPYDSYIAPADQATLTAYSRDFARELAGVSDRLRATGARVTYVDLAPQFASYGYYQGGWRAAGFDQFGAYGSCLTGAYMEAPRTLCGDPERRVFWDEYHPTRHAHELIAKAVLDALAK